MFILSSSLGYDYLSPGKPLGLFILIIGILFTMIICYIFVNVNRNIDSLADKKSKEKQYLKQQESIARLYPSKK